MQKYNRNNPQKKKNQTDQYRLNRRPKWITIDAIHIDLDGIHPKETSDKTKIPTARK
jgi:hypothetical protein